MEPIEILVILAAISVGAFVLAPGLLHEDGKARKALSRLQAYEGYIGVCVALFGGLALVILVFAHGWWLLFPLSVIGAAIILVILGFLLGYPLISERALTNYADAKQRAEAFRARWGPRQNMLAWSVVFLGVSALILHTLR